MESCVKNCGSLVHDEIATKGFMEELRELVKHSKEDDVKNKLLELLQTWGMAFRSNQKYRIVTVSKENDTIYGYFINFGLFLPIMGPSFLVGQLGWVLGTLYQKRPSQKSKKK